MAFNIMDLMNATTKAAAGENNEYQEITLGIRDIVVTRHNKYSMDGLKDLAAALEASKADEETQKEIAQASESKGGVGAEEIRAMTEEKKGRKTKEEETREANVSDTDTTEEEKENARKLHAVKMIEKYYTWLNEEEVGILEAMLEDCKRRKREYAIEEA